ncbi:glycoside hydrolase domain-containing protein [Rapidithrix thailandica]|uniref:Glycoside hydrolase domain-containing protein n=1 Tax=Rapidithrix thailandica TaxID=413964 RepID=A0AAW9S4M6_9BACT
MKKLPLLASMLVGGMLLWQCQGNQKQQESANVETAPPVQRATYDFEEMTDPAEVPAEEWQKVEAGLLGSVASVDERYAKSFVPKLTPQTQWKGFAWKNERVYAQLALWTKEGAKAVEIVPGDLTSQDGATIAASAIRPAFLRYVMTDEFAGGCGYRKSVDFDSSLVADALDERQFFDIEPQSTRPVWLTVNVPNEAKAGVYTGTVKVQSEGNEALSFDLQLEVVNQTVPEAKDWNFYLDIWQNPFAVARFHEVELWSKEHFDLLRPLLTRLADAGQKCITTSIIHAPWGGQTYDHFEAMIDWKKKKDGTWAFDYTAFDRYVEFAMDCGITKSINCYSMVPWGNQFRYFDEALNGYDTLTLVAGSEEHNAYWTPFLTDFRKHLSEKGWLEKTSIAMDERKVEEMQGAINLVKSIAPEIKIALAGTFHEEIEADIYDLCVASRETYEKSVLTDRPIDKDKITTYYVCCTEEYPNNFSFSPPAQSAWIGWYAAAKGYNGFLRWAYNSWVKNPLQDSRFRAWPAGDTYFVYPGNMSSIRFERLREGIQEYEKVLVLSEKFKKENNQEALNKLQKALDVFEIKKFETVSGAEMVNEAKAIVDELSRR